MKLLARIYRAFFVRLRRNLAVIGIYLVKKTDDRHILEKEIFPFVINNEELKDILFVGCAWFTKRYNSWFRRKDFTTLEIDPALKKYGAKKHIVDSIENIEKHFQHNQLDVIFINGVFGWGLDNKDVVENSFEGCYSCLKPGGMLIVGWNDIPERKPFPLEECESINKFSPYKFPPLGADKLLTSNPNRHTFNFYTKQ